MSIADKLNKLQTDITNAYSSIGNKGGTIPTNKNTENLASAIDSITGGGSGITLENIVITQVGTTEYYVGEIFSLNDYTIIANYSNGNTLDVTEYCTFTPNRVLNETDTSVTITYTSVESGISKSVTQEITVIEQVINYTMLYDGSLGESGENGANVCSDITGGYDTNINLQSGYQASNVSFDVNNITFSGESSSSNIQSLICSKEMIDLTSYKSACVILEAEREEVGKCWNTAYFSSIRGFADVSSRDAQIVASYFGEKTLKSLDININKNAYLTVYASGARNYSYLLKLYNVFLTKEDDWQTLASIAGITASSIDDILTNSTTLLSSKEAVRYMIYNCTGTFMLKAIQSSLFLTALNNSSYKTIIQANEHWNKFLNMVA